MPQILTFLKINGRRQMSVATSGRTVNFYEKRAKVTQGHLNKARDDWLLYWPSRSLTEAVSPPLGCNLCNSDGLRNQFLCHRSGDLPPGLSNQILLVGMGLRQELALPIQPCLHPSWDLESHANRCPA